MKIIYKGAIYKSSSFEELEGIDLTEAAKRIFAKLKIKIGIKDFRNWVEFGSKKLEMVSKKLLGKTLYDEDFNQLPYLLFYKLGVFPKNQLSHIFIADEIINKINPMKPAIPLIKSKEWYKKYEQNEK